VYEGPAAGVSVWSDAEWDTYYSALPGIRWTREAGPDLLIYHKPVGDTTEIVAMRYNVKKDDAAKSAGESHIRSKT